jgi:hypothetical protein
LAHISRPSIAPETRAGSPLGHRVAPKLRTVEPVWVEVDGQPHVWLRDRLSLGKGSLLVPAPLAPLLGAMDGTRDCAAVARE